MKVWNQIGFVLGISLAAFGAMAVHYDVHPSPWVAVAFGVFAMLDSVEREIRQKGLDK